MNRRLVELLALAALIADLAACTTTASPYPASSRGGGWENFRAEAPSDQPAAPVANSVKPPSLVVLRRLEA